MYFMLLLLFLVLRKVWSRVDGFLAEDFDDTFEHDDKLSSDQASKCEGTDLTLSSRCRAQVQFYQKTIQSCMQLVNTYLVAISAAHDSSRLVSHSALRCIVIQRILAAMVRRWTRLLSPRGCSTCP
jgi:hypothetical protein